MSLSHEEWMDVGSGQRVVVLGLTRTEASSGPASRRSDRGQAIKGRPL